MNRWWPVLFVLAGCPRPAPRPNVSVEILAPMDGARLTRADDKNAALDGVQIDVRVQVDGAQAGTRASLAAGELVVSAAIIEGVAEFPAFSLPFGEVTLSATAEEGSAEVRVTVEDTGALCDFVTPRAGDVLGPSDDVSAVAGFQTDVVVSCVGLAVGTVMQLGLEGRTRKDIVLDSTGRASLANFSLAEGPNTLVLSGEGIDVRVNVDVNTGRCLAELQPEDGHTFLASSGRDLTFITTCAVGSIVTLQISGEASCGITETRELVSTVGADGTTLFASAPMYEFSNIVGARVQETLGRQGRALDNVYHVDSVPPQIGFVFPDNGTDLSIVDEDLATPGFQVNVRGQALGIEAGSVQRLRVTGGDGVITDYETEAISLTQGCFVQTASVGAFSWTVTFADGPTELLYTISDAAGNTVSRVVNVIVDARQPALAIGNIVPNAFLTLQDDVDSTAGLQVSVLITIVNAADLNGLDGSVVVSGQPPVFFTYNASPQSVTVQLLDTDVATLEATVTLQNGRLIRSAAVPIRVDATPPYLSQLSPRDGDVVGAGAASIDVSVALGSEPQSRDVRLGGMTSTIAASGPLSHTFSNVPLAPGANTLTVEADDRIGSKKNTSQLVLHVYRALGPPTIAFTQINGLSGLAAPPTVNELFDADVTDGFDVSASAHMTAVPGPVFVELLVGATGPTHLWLRQTYSVPSSGQLDISDLDFSLWANEDVPLFLRVSETLTGATSGFASVIVNADAGANDYKVAITAPPYGVRTRQTTFDIAIETDSGLNGVSKSCAWQVGPSGGAPLMLTGSTGLFDDATLPLSEGINGLLVACTAPSGIAFYSQRQLIDFRVAAPSVTFSDATGVQLSTGPYYFNAQAPDTGLASGYQQDVTVVTDQPDGTSVSLIVDAAPAVTGAVVNGQVLFRNVTLTTSDAVQTITLTAQLTDAYGAGNVSVTRNVLIDREPPSIAFAAGTCVSTITRFNPFDNDQTYEAIEWDAVYAASGATAVMTRVTDFAGTHDFSSTRIAFAVDSPPAAYGAAFVGVARDGADNVAMTPTCTPTIDPTTPVISFGTQREDFPAGVARSIGRADDSNSALGGIQTTFLVTILNLGAGATVHLCSTANDPSLASAPTCGAVPGKVLASGSSTASGSGVTQAVLTNVNLVDGTYGLAVEVIDLSTMRTAVVQTVPVTVDSSLPPSLVSVSSALNVTGNDRVGVLVLNASEGDTSVANKLDPLTMTLTMSGSTSGATAILRSSVHGTLSTAPAATGNQFVFDDLGPLAEGLHAMTLIVTGAAGNQGSSPFQLFIDVTPPQVVVGSPTQGTYTCPTLGTCPAPSGVTATVDVAVSDNFSLSGGCACARSAPACATCEALGNGSAQLINVDAVLAEGTNAVVGEVHDGAGNITISATSVDYHVDTVATEMPPMLEVSTPGACSSFASSCTIAFDTGPSGCHDGYPDDPPSDPGNAATPLCARWYASDTYAVTTSGTTAAACQITGDVCTHSIRLLGTPLDGISGAPIGVPVEVFLSARADLPNDVSAFIEDIAPARPPPGLDRATRWSIVVEARDRYGNFNRSAPRYVSLPSFGGALVSIEKVTGSTGAIASGEAFGVRHNKNAQATPYVTDLRVALTWTVTPPMTNPRCVRLAVGGVDYDATSNAATTGQETIAFDDVTLPDPGAPFVISALVDASGTCGLSSVGAVDLSGLTTTVTLPSSSFDCAWRKAMGFNAAGDDCVSASPVARTGVAQTPLADLLEDADSGVPGFQFPQAVRVTVANAMGGLVTVRSNLGLLGQTSLAVAGTGATFDNSLTVPTVMNAGAPALTQTHTLSVEACNAAGDCVTSPQTLQLKANADPPAQAGAALVCTGTDDDSACASLCTPSTCDRRAGKAVLSFVAPGANLGTTSTVSGYDVAVAIAASGDCNTAITDGAVRYDRLFVDVSPATPMSAGQTQTLQVSGLPIHQRLCIAPLAKDDVGNYGPPNAVSRTTQLEAVMAGTQVFPAAENANAMATVADADGAPGAAIAVGDMDGDGGVEIAMSVLDATSAKVYIFSSRRTQAGNFAPREIITQNPVPGTTPGFARALAGGDFNGDNYADLAIAAVTAGQPDGSAGYGAVYVYYGSGGPTGSDPRLIQEATCTASNVPTPACPNVVLYRPNTAPFAGAGWSLASGHISNALTQNDGRKKTLTFPADLLIGEFRFSGGATYLVRHGAPFFKTQTSTEVFNLTAASGLTTFTTTQRTGTAVTAADMNGDGYQDIILGADGHTLLMYDAAGALPATRSEADAQRCDSVSQINGSVNLQRLGPISATSSDWLVARKGSSWLQIIEGSTSFFPGSSTCANEASRTDSWQVSATPPVGDDVGQITHELLPITAWGASLDDTCNDPRHSRIDAIDLFGVTTSAGPVGDFNGDGRDDFIIGQSGFSTNGSDVSRAFIVTYAPPVCSPAGSKLRVLAQLFGDNAQGPGAHAFGAWSHAGTAYPSIGLAGARGGSGSSAAGLWIFR